MDRLLPRLVAARGFGDADDIASVLHHRVERATARPAGSGRTRKAPRLIAGLVPHADGPMYTDMRRALDERRELIEARTDAVLDAARDAREAWTKPLGVPPRDSRKATAWRRHARTVAAYRDRYRITDDTPLGWPLSQPPRRSTPPVPEQHSTRQGTSLVNTQRMSSVRRSSKSFSARACDLGLPHSALPTRVDWGVEWTPSGIIVCAPSKSSIWLRMPLIATLHDAPGAGRHRASSRGRRA